MQFDIFGMMYDDYKIKNKVRIIELFGGYGSQSMALERMGIDFEHYKLVEFDKYAVQSYNKVHGTNFETSDITETKGSDLNIVETDKYDYIMTYSFPCQDLSNAGLRNGISEFKCTAIQTIWKFNCCGCTCKYI